MAKARIPFWFPIVAPTLSNEHLCHSLGVGASKLATLRIRYGMPLFQHDPSGPLYIDWLLLLGLVEDDVLAELVSQRYSVQITKHLIAQIRADLGVASYAARKIKLDPNIRKLVGQYSSSNIAKGWDVGHGAVEAYRQLASINTAAPDQRELLPDGRWPREWIELFPKHTNVQISRITGLGLDLVRAKRRSLRIAAPTSRTYWKTVGPDDLESFTDLELANRFGGPVADYAAQRLAITLQSGDIAKTLIADQKLPDTLIHFLDAMPTQRLAKITGLSMYALKKQRVGLGIAPYNPISEELDGLLSKMPDTAIAERCNVSVATVKYRRDKLGKPAYIAGRRTRELG